ncbi:MAG TPA: Lrp/AsnC family transcriptional regulator [Rhizomicrobium sp.]|jgi:Lrp/AsnC family transcriptional regulator
MPEPDSIDIRLLGLLQDDASAPIAELCEHVHLSQNACWRRIRRLEEEGFIRKRVALLDARKLGVGTTVFVMIKAGQHSEEWLAKFAAAVQRIPEIVEFYRMAGDVDYLLKLQVADISAYDAVYKSLIRSAPPADISAVFAMEELKHSTALPLPAGKA